MTSNNWSSVWINSSFNENHGNATQMHSNKRSFSAHFDKHLTKTSVTSDNCLSNNQYECWSEKYAPKNRQQLAVGNKKIKQLSDWLSTRFAQQNNNSGHQFNSPFLLINGPTGSGKTTALRILSDEINVKILELKSSDQYLETDPFGILCNPGSILANNQLEKFKKFVWDANKYKNSFECNDQQTSLCSQNNISLNRSKQLILIEEFPSVFHYKPQLLFEELKRLRRSFGSQCVPIVFIISELNNGNSVEFKLLPKDVQTELQIEVISFNSVTNNALNNTLSRISENQLPKNCIQEIVDCSAGDIRSALNLLQIKYMHTISETNSVLNDGLKSKRQKKSFDHNFYTGSRDNALTLPHAIGKILYAKRSAKHALDCMDTCCSYKVAKQYERIPLIENPETIFDKLMVSSDSLNMWLHQNYLDFVDDITGAEQCIHWLSESDFMFTAQDINNKSFCDEYRYSVATRGIMFNVSTNITDVESNSKNSVLKKKYNRSFKSFNKPKIYDVIRCINSLTNHSIHSLHFTDIFKHINVNILVTDIIPFVSQMPTHFHSLNSSMKSLLDSIVNYNDLHSNKLIKHYHSTVNPISNVNTKLETDNELEIDCNSD